MRGRYIFIEVKYVMQYEMVEENLMVGVILMSPPPEGGRHLVSVTWVSREQIES